MAAHLADWMAAGLDAEKDDEKVLWKAVTMVTELVGRKELERVVEWAGVKVALLAGLMAADLEQ